MAGENRILTSHVGSLPRPVDWLDMMKARIEGRHHDEAAYERRLTRAVADIVQQQVDVGLDIVADGEMSKPGFFIYASERLAGFERRPEAKYVLFEKEVAAFPEYYEDYFKRAMLGGTVTKVVPIYCVGPVKYTGEAAVARDIANLKAAVAKSGAKAAFMPSTAPSAIPYNEHYKSEEEYFYAVGEAMRVEYKAIVDAGLIVQIDDPFLADIFADFKDDPKKLNQKAGLYVDVINHAIRGIPEEKVRFHTCYGINEGPRIFESSLFEMLGHMLRIKAKYYSFEGANCRHEHEYHVFEKAKLPKGKVVIPGVITHASNIVEHPVLIAERLTRYARLVGRENVIAGADCGFSSQACYKTEVHPKVMWEKFRAMVEGARIASKELWKKAPAKRAGAKKPAAKSAAAKKPAARRAAAKKPAAKRAGGAR
jgi:5-methyltetrahydropteroyltriglutamate--homocysteine methyltransferase